MLHAVNSGPVQRMQAFIRELRSTAILGLSETIGSKDFEPSSDHFWSDEKISEFHQTRNALAPLVKASCRIKSGTRCLSGKAALVRANAYPTIAETPIRTLIEQAERLIGLTRPERAPAPSPMPGPSEGGGVNVALLLVVGAVFAFSARKPS